jgi:hypothetical protein
MSRKGYDEYKIYAYRENGKIILHNYKEMKRTSRKYVGKVDWNWINQFFYAVLPGCLHDYITDGYSIYRMLYNKPKNYPTDSVKDVETTKI